MGFSPAADADVAPATVTSAVATTPASPVAFNAFTSVLLVVPPVPASWRRMSTVPGRRGRRRAAPGPAAGFGGMRGAVPARADRERVIPHAHAKRPYCRNAAHQAL